MRGNKTIYWALPAVLLLGTLFLMPSGPGRLIGNLTRDALAPYQALSAAAGDRRRGLAERLRRRNESAAMAAELRELRREVMLLSAVSAENAELRRQLGYIESAPFDLIACRVIARGDMTGWWRTLRINRGAAAGVETSMAVVSEHGLVGRVLRTSRHTADVLLISDASSRVSVRVLPSGAFGILEGAAPDLTRRDTPHLLLPGVMFRVDFLGLRDEIGENDLVVTSGLGGVFPAGLPVGRIAGIRPDASGLYRRAELAPAGDLERLGAIYVVRSSVTGERL